MGSLGGVPTSHRPRAGGLLTEVLRFLAVGGIATVVSVLGFNTLVHGTPVASVDSAPMRHEPIPAYVLANAVAGAVAYAGMRLWAFRHREVTMAIPVLCLAISRYLLGLSDVWADNLSANVIGLGLSTAARFWVFRRWVFLEAGPAAEPGGA